MVHIPLQRLLQVCCYAKVYFCRKIFYTYQLLPDLQIRLGYEMMVHLQRLHNYIFQLLMVVLMTMSTDFRRTMNAAI